MSHEVPPSKEEPLIEILRQAPVDVEGATNVYYKTWLATYPNEDSGVTREDVEEKFSSSFSEKAMQKRMAYIENMGENELSLVAKENGKIVGVCSVIKEDDINILKTIYVLPEYQGKGVGSKMWDEAKRFLNEQNDTVVEVVDYNKNAINFYKSKGFEETGNRRQDEKFRMKSGAIFTEIEMKRPADKPRVPMK